MKVKPIFFGYSWVGILNFLLLQWFFIRLEAVVDQPGASDFEWEVSSLAIRYPVVPLTGWWGFYVPLRPRRSRKIWRSNGNGDS